MTRVLSVEDSATQAEQLRLVLESEGFEVETARDGAEALDKLRSAAFDLVVTDIVMPGLSGYDLCRRIKAKASSGDVPVVLLTTLRDPMDIIEGLECGADNFVTKPYEPEYLLGRIRNVLENRKLRDGKKMKLGVEVFFLGRKFTITSDREQILDLLISTFEDVVRSNQKLEERQRELTRSHQTLQGLYRVAMSLNKARSVDDVISEALARTLELPGVRAGWSYVRGADGAFRLAGAHGLSQGLELPPTADGSCACQKLLLEGAMPTVVSVRDCERLKGADGGRPPHHATIPLWCGERILGVLNLAGAEQELFAESEMEILRGIGHQVGVALERGLLRRSLEERAEISEGKYRSLMDQARDGIFVLDANGVVVEVNRQGEEQLGRSRSDVLGRVYVEFASPTDRPLLSSAFRGALETGTGYVASIAPVRPDGRSVALEVNGAGGTFGGKKFVIAITRDVTSRKRSARLKEAQHAVTTALVESASLDEVAPRILGVFASSFRADVACLWIVDPAEYLLRVREVFVGHGTSGLDAFAATSRGALLQTGEGLPGMAWSRSAPVWLHDFTGEPGGARGAAAGSAGLRSGFAVPVVGAGGVLGVIELLSREGKEPPDDELLDASKAMGAQVGLFLQRERAVASLRSSEARYRLLFERNLAGVFRTNLEGEILECNDAAARIGGFKSASELVHRSIADAYLAPGERGALIDRLRAEGTLTGVEIRVKSVEGKPLTLLSNLSIVERKEGGTEIEGTVIDVTERRSLEDQLRQSQKMEAIGRLAGGIAHDFNNLLTVILGFADLLATGCREGRAPGGEVAEIRKAAERAAALTRQLLAFSRKQVVRPEPLDLGAVVSGLDRLLRRLIGEDIELLSSGSSDLGLVMADAGQIEQLLMNLVVNARDAMPDGGKLTIETRNVKLDATYCQTRVGVLPGEYVMVAVSDSGIGMDEETRARLFEPFFTTKEKGKGTGLGLATVYGIAKQSGGHIWVYSAPGLGSSFKVYFPRLLEAPKSRPLSSSSMAAVPAQGKGNETVLVVEDEAPIRRLARTILEANGYRVLETESAEDALALSEKTTDPIELLVTDLVLTGMNGRRLSELIAAKRPETRIVLMSGYTDDSAVRSGHVPNGAVYLQKPFSPGQLLSKVRSVLDAT